MVCERVFCDRSVWVTSGAAAKNGIVGTDNDIEIEMESDSQVDIDTGTRYPFAALPGSGCPPR
jgi:hypothetical protein